MYYTNMYSNIKVYQKYLVTSIKVGCATRSLYASSGPKAEGVPTNNQRGRLFCIKSVHLSDKLSLMCHRVWPEEDNVSVFIYLNVF